MKILCTRFPLESIRGGGAETQVLNLARGLRERRHAVAFVGSCEALLDACHEANLMNAELDLGPPPVSKLHALTFAWRKNGMRRKLAAMLDEFGSLDVIIMLSLTEKLLLTDFATKRGIRVIWIEHDPVGKWLTKNPWLNILKKQSQLATTVTVSEKSREQYLELDFPRAKTVAIPNGIDDVWLKEKPAAIRDDTPTLHLGCVARLAREKGVDLLLKAIVLEEHVRLDIVGVGAERHALTSLTRHLGLENRVRFLGRIDDLPAFYRSIDALVLPSRSDDPFGMVVAEAMAIGVPCLVTDACGIASCLEGGSDVLVVQSGDVRALADGIQQLKEAAMRRALSARGRKAALQQFSVSTMVDRYETLFTGKPLQ